MDFSWLSSACDLIILVGAVFLAFDRIVKPIIFIKKKTNSTFEEKVGEAIKKYLPDILDQHYKDIKKNLTKDTTDAVMEEIKDELTQVKLLEQQYDILVLTAKDVLREKIMKIYNDYRKDKKLPLSKKEQLEQYYIDYKRLNGNSYIDKYYNRMQRWDVVDEEDDCDEDK